MIDAIQEACLIGGNTKRKSDIYFKKNLLNRFYMLI